MKNYEKGNSKLVMKYILFFVIVTLLSLGASAQKIAVVLDAFALTGRHSNTVLPQGVTLG